MIFVNVLILVIGFCTFAAEFASDLKQSLRPIQKDLILLDINGSNAIRITKIKQKFSDFIDFHSEARQLSQNRLNEILRFNQFFIR